MSALLTFLSLEDNQGDTHTQYMTIQVYIHIMMNYTFTDHLYTTEHTSHTHYSQYILSEIYEARSESKNTGAPVAKGNICLVC